MKATSPHGLPKLIGGTAQSPLIHLYVSCLAEPLQYRLNLGNLGKRPADGTAHRKFNIDGQKLRRAGREKGDWNHQEQSQAGGHYPQRSSQSENFVTQAPDQHRSIYTLQIGIPDIIALGGLRREIAFPHQQHAQNRHRGQSHQRGRQQRKTYRHREGGEELSHQTGDERQGNEHYNGAQS